MISIQTGRTFATCLSSLPAAFQTTEKNSHGQKHIGRPGENTKENGLFSTPAENTASSWSETERRFAESGIAGEHITRNDACCAAGCSKVKYCVEHTYNARVCCYIEQVIAKDSIISYTSGHFVHVRQLCDLPVALPRSSHGDQRYKNANSKIRTVFSRRLYASILCMFSKGCKIKTIKFIRWPDCGVVCVSFWPPSEVAE